jgi:membrane protease YdiL (CAAX protease family)
MDPARVLPIVAFGEGFMLVVAVMWARGAGILLFPGPWAIGVVSGLAGAVALGAVNLALMRWRGRSWPGESLRNVCRVIVHPLFEHVSVWQILLVSTLAGLAEEFLFRGVLQVLIGLPAASVLFGMVHVGGRGFVGYGVWAAIIGAFFGWLMHITGGLAAPVVAHAVYDALALAYVRFGSIELCD